MTHLRSGVLLALAAVLSLTAVTAAPSAATYTDRSTSTATVTAAVDWVPPTVSLHPLPSSARGAVVVGADAADAESSVVRVEMEVRPAGASTWTALCTDTSAPFGCTWDTTAVADGAYEVRARAVDAYANVSGWVTNAVAVRNGGPAVAVRVPSGTLWATVHVTAERTDGSTTVRSQGIDLRRAGSSSWSSLCEGWGNPVTCNWQTHKYPDGAYELRAWSVDAGGQVSYSDVVRAQVGNGKSAAATSTATTDASMDASSQEVTP
ncbi:Ig-like domain-containing protein [Serinicoccus chungangensis]|uniref:Ig-like domain-containing protein n=1 Tax=Serinicoccus chungangensis TaxID=767452 RepID=UPI00111ABF0A|nr:Ig-like domain-containing protein [Serinicoccus chungangensis]